MASITSKTRWLYREAGLKSLHDTGRDAYLIILCRCCRMLAYGATSVILALFFAELDFSDSRIGLFMTLTLLGDVLLSGFFTLVADRLGRRRILLVGSLMMVFSGAAFAIFENFWILLLAAVVGVISATGGDAGPFRAIEESTLSHLTSPSTRADVLSWFVTTASLGSAIGAEASGRIVHLLQDKAGWSLIDAYHAGFWMYTATGITNTVFVLLLTKNCEASPPDPDTETKTEESGVLLNEMGEPQDTQPEPTASLPKRSSWLSQISKDTRAIMYKLWFLLTVDSLADGMTGNPLTIYYMDLKLHLRKSTLGDITSISYFLSALSTVFAGPLSRHLGLINTMVFTHLPSSAAVLLFPAPRGAFLTVALFFVRTALNNMDQAPRSAFIAAVVKPEERTAVMGLTNILRTLAMTVGPSVTGLLAGSNRFWIAFVAAGTLRIGYDLGLWAMFVNMRLHRHEEEGMREVDGVKGRRQGDVGGGA